MKEEKNNSLITKKEEKLIEETISEFLKMLEVDGVVEIIPTEGGVDVILNTQDTGIVIGRHGEVLESLQVILSAIVSKKLDRFIHVSLEVGEYKKNRKEWLENLVRSTKERVLSENQEISLPGLKSWERRVVHLLLKEDEQVISESVGEGKERTLIIKPRE